MKTKNTHFVFCIFVIPIAIGSLLPIAYSFAQTPGQWTWMHGDNTPNASGVFGTKGVPNPANTPPALYEPCEWTDLNGNFWLFGGLENTYYATLWKYDSDPTSPTFNQWTWMKGSSFPSQFGVYGTQGVPAAANTPGARSYGAVTWVDLSGNLWLFGGSGLGASNAGRLNDLWKYTITTNEWTWMKGPSTVDSPGSYGVKGVSAPTNLPPARDETSCSWTDNAGNLWLYGGGSSTINNFYGDLWKYNIGTNEWTWMHGANTPNPPDVYGTQGVAAPANTPGSRIVYCSWTDPSGNLWLFGGARTFGSTIKNDLWKYDIISNQWAWMKGPTANNDAGNYGARCVTANSNTPPSRYENRARVRDACGNFWGFGGRATANGDLNDLWHYNITTNQWTWVSGDNITNQAAVYGTKGVSSPTIKPGGKMGSVAWMDKKGYIWIFGGVTNGVSDKSNDLFRFVPDTACGAVPKTAAAISVSSNSTICNGQSATLTASGGTSYLWSPGGQTTASIAVTPSASASYTVAGTTLCGTGSALVTITVISPVNATAGPGTTICSGQNATLTASGGNNYAWSNGQTSATITPSPSATTTYSVIVGSGSCTDTAYATVTVNSGLIVNAGNNATVCAGTTVILTATASGGNSYNWSNGQLTSSITVTATATVTYTVIATDANGCTGIDSVTVVVTPFIIANAGPDGTICAGETFQLNASGGNSYNWSPSQGLNNPAINNPAASPVNTTTYTVIVSSGSCSPDTDVVTVVVNPNPTALAWNNVTITAGSSTTLAASGGGMYSWSNGSSDSIITVSPPITTIYCITVTDSNGCTHDTCVTIVVENQCGEVFVPNAFSPNGDTENDEFCILGGGDYCIKDLHITIYNRWGENVFESTDKNFCWDGTHNNEPQNTAVFVFYMNTTLLTGKTITKKGNVSLIR